MLTLFQRVMYPWKFKLVNLVFMNCSYLNNIDLRMKSSLWTKRIIFGIINNEIQKMDFKLVVCVQVKYRNQKNQR